MSLKQFQPYRDSVQFIESLINLSEPQKRIVNLSSDEKFKGLNYLLNLLGNPQKKYKIIHVAGTSGKGTTCQLIQNVLKTAGFNTGLYTSPHAVTTIERIKTNDLYISPEKFSELTEKIKPFWQKMIEQDFPAPTYFEALMSIAFVYFAEQKCDYVVLETGMGGLYDASNVIPSPIVSVITNIHYDHQEFLGKTLTKICKEKAGIIKNKSKFFTTEKRKHLQNILEKKCLEKNAKFNLVKFNNKKEKKYFQKFNAHCNADNILLAFKIGEALNISKEIIEKGLKIKLEMPCRYEKMQSKPKVILDGSHNPSKIKYLTENIAKEKFAKLYLICGFSKDKDAFGSIKYLLPLCSEVLATRFLMPLRKTFPIKKLADCAKENNIPSKIFLDPRDALSYALKKAKANDLILIAGSFYLCGQLKQHWISEEKFLKKLK